MDQVVYVCTGTCQAQVSEDEYKNGLTKCGAETCTMHNHAFEKRLKCATCEVLYKENENHTH